MLRSIVSLLVFHMTNMFMVIRITDFCLLEVFHHHFIMLTVKTWYFEYVHVLQHQK